MKNKKNSLAKAFSAIFVLFLSLPAIGYFFNFSPGTPLFGYVETKTNKPETIIKGWFNKKLQAHLEELINQEIGFKALFTRLFNGLIFRLFAEQQHNDIYSTRQHGVYFKNSIAHLNDEYVHREQLGQIYDELAVKLAEIQQLLTAKGKHFEVIISSSKPYIHLEGLGKRFLVNTDDNLYDKLASLGRSLKMHGVNVIDSGPILREFYKRKAIETHAYSSLHWNYYAGCIIAKHFFKDLRKTFPNTPSLHCGTPHYRPSELIDLDGLQLMNVFGKVHLIKKSPYPSPSANLSGDYLPKMLIVGDSYMHQILNSLDQAKSYSTITISSYFRSNIKHKPGELLVYFGPPTSEPIENAVLEAAMNTEVVILQMADFNVTRLGYGFIEPFLKRLKETARANTSYD